MNNLDKNRIAKNFSRAAHDYEQHAVLQKLVAERLLARLDLIKLSPRQIIDAGAGAGASARALKKKYRSARIIQIDLSQAMLLHSRQKSSRWFSGHYFVCGDAEYLPLETGKADLVFSSLMLQWCNKPDRAFAETRRVLRPGGLYLFATLGPDTLGELRQSWSGVDDGGHVHSFMDMHDIGDALTREGMEGVVMETERITLTYKDCVQLMRDLKTLGANNAHSIRNKGLTGRDKLQRLVQNYEKFRSGEVLPATYEIVYGHAWALQPAREKAPAPEAFVPVSAIRRHHVK